MEDQASEPNRDNRIEDPEMNVFLTSYVRWVRYRAERAARAEAEPQALPLASNGPVNRREGLPPAA